jgi:hypothetical protein
MYEFPYPFPYIFVFCHYPFFAVLWRRPLFGLWSAEFIMQTLWLFLSFPHSASLLWLCSIGFCILSFTFACQFTYSRKSFKNWGFMKMKRLFIQLRDQNIYLLNSINNKCDWIPALIFGQYLLHRIPIIHISQNNLQCSTTKPCYLPW